MALTRAQRAALTDIATRALYVGRDPGRPDAGSGIYPATLRILTTAGLVARGPYEPGRGRRLLLTDAGRAATQSGP